MARLERERLRPASCLAFFKLLLSVKGIGPKAALAILSRAELRVLKRAVLQEDAALLATVPAETAEDAVSLVFDDVRRFAVGAEQADDITVLALRRIRVA